MEQALYNPVYNALLSGDAPISLGDNNVKYFDEEVSPFAGFHHEYNNGFNDLYDQLPEGREILFATPKLVDIPPNWKTLARIKGLQFVYSNETIPQLSAVSPVQLDKTNAAEMVQLAALTKPGPFAMRTIEFGYYYGFFENDKLAAMTGQRLHVGDHTEISAVCTHPDQVGRGYAAALIVHQLHLIYSQGKKAFLHVRADNERAIALYERLGFTVNIEMIFYFLKRKG